MMELRGPAIDPSIGPHTGRGQHVASPFQAMSLLTITPMPDLNNQPPAAPADKWQLPARISPAVVPILLCAFFALVGAFFILFEHVPSRVFYDQELYHRPTINQFAAQWPHFDFWHYLSA